MNQPKLSDFLILIISFPVFVATLIIWLFMPGKEKEIF